MASRHALRRRSAPPARRTTIPISAAASIASSESRVAPAASRSARVASAASSFAPDAARTGDGVPPTATPAARALRSARPSRAIAWRVRSRSAESAAASCWSCESSQASRSLVSCWMAPTSKVAAASARPAAAARSAAFERLMLAATLVRTTAATTAVAARAHSAASRRTRDEVRGCTGMRGWSSRRTGGSDRIHLSVAATGHPGITRIRDTGPVYGARRSFATNAACVIGIFAAKSSSIAAA
jgi:hypothetical protein